MEVFPVFTKRVHRFIEQACAAGPIVAVCAPPGFETRRLLQSLAEPDAGEGGVSYFDRLDHLADPTCAAQAVMDMGNAARRIIVEDADLCDARWLGSALQRFARGAGAGQIFLGMSNPQGLSVLEEGLAQPIPIVGPAVLRLTRAEAARAFRKIARPANRMRILDLIGGWPHAAVRLSHWAAGAQTDAWGREDIDILRDCGIYDVVERRVLPLLDDSQKQALAAASLVPSPDRELLHDEVRTDRVLASVARVLSGLVDIEGQHYTINPALAACVREWSLLQDPAGHRRRVIALADRCSRNGRLTDAARLAGEAAMPERVRAYAEEHGALLIWVLCGFADLAALVKNASDEVIAASPELRMMRCIVNLKSGRINLAEQELRNLSEDPRVANSMQREIEIVRVTLLVYGCALARRDDLEFLTELLSEQSSEPGWQTFLATLACVLNSQRARFDAAEANLREARLGGGGAGSRYNLMFLHAHQATIDIARGKLVEARASLAKARKMWRDEFSTDQGVETVIAALGAKVEFETGRLTSARNSLRKSAQRMPEAEAWFDIYFAAYEPMTRIYVKDHGIARTIQLVEQERAKLEARGLGRIGNLLGAVMACLVGEARLGGNGVDVEPPLTDFSGLAASSWQERELFSLAATHEMHRAGKTAEAIALLSDAREEAGRSGAVHSVSRMTQLLFALRHVSGDREGALREVAELASLGIATGMRQTCADMLGGYLADYVAQLAAQPDADEAQLHFLRSVMNRDRAARASASELSKRETDVLRALATGGSDKELARELGISDHGVRFHLKGVFKKLGVHDRLSAVVRAQEKGWI